MKPPVVKPQGDTSFGFRDAVPVLEVAEEIVKWLCAARLDVRQTLLDCEGCFLPFAPQR